MVLLDEDDKHQRQQVPNIINVSQSCKLSKVPETVPNLSMDIIFQILLRLPVSSLLRFRSVCKQWWSVISDPHFVKSHLSLSTSNKHYDHHRLIYSTGTQIKLCHLCDIFSNDTISASEVDYPFKPQIFPFIVGSCNGLLCMSIGNDILYIWNPSTRKSNRLPSNGPKMRPSWYTMYSFGYDESTDDYKVVEISYMVKDTINFETFVSIYSLNNGRWKEIGGFSNSILPSYHYSVFLNGALHWLATIYFGSSYIGTIISMNLANETYGEVLQPLYDEGDKGLTLGALREWLCVACTYQAIRVDFWVMKVYGVKDSWTKLVSIMGSNDHLERFHHLVPLWIINNEKILFQLWMSLYCYDFKSKSILEIDYWLGARTYVESLVSPYSPSMHGRQESIIN